MSYLHDIDDEDELVCFSGLMLAIKHMLLEEDGEEPGQEEPLATRRREYLGHRETPTQAVRNLKTSSA